MSIAKVAQLAGVSNTTVSYVINNKPGISLGTISRVKAAMRDIGYVPRPRNFKSLLRNKSGGLRTGNIGVAMPEYVISTVPFYARLFDSIHHALDDKGLKMISLKTSKNSSFSAGALTDLDGILLCFYSKELIERLNLPLVSILGHPSAEDELMSDHVEPANDRIGVMAAKYFIGRGHKKILAINPNVGEHPPMRIRAEYFVNTSEKYGINAESRKVPFAERDDNGRLFEGDRIESIGEFISEYKALADKPTGIFVPSDSHLVVLQKSFSAAGIRLGVDVEFLGCDNENTLLDCLDVRPATIDINPKAIAKAAINLLLQRLGDFEAGDTTFQMVSILPSMVAGGTGTKEW